jgi:hypothetical protein
MPRKHFVKLPKDQRRVCQTRLPSQTILKLEPSEGLMNSKLQTCICCNHFSLLSRGRRGNKQKKKLKKKKKKERKKIINMGFKYNSCRNSPKYS